MKFKTWFFIGCWMVVLSGKAPDCFADEAIKWLAYTEGTELAKKERKKILVTFFADWCRYCKLMEEHTFRDQQLIEFVNANFIAIRVDSDKDQTLSDQFDVKGLPTTWFLSAEGQKIDAVPGYITEDKLLLILKFLQSDSFKRMSFKEYQANASCL